MFPNVLSTWIRGLLSVAILVAGALLVKRWADELPRSVPVVTSAGAGTARHLDSFPERLEAWAHHPGGSVAPLAAGLVLFLFAFGGRAASPRLWKRAAPPPSVHPEEVQRLRASSGCHLHVETYGPVDAPPILMVHGLGSDHTQWLEAIEDLSDRFRVIVYDILGHGRSEVDRWADHSVEAMADDLNQVMALAGGRKMILVGHSMGGMIALTWCGLNARRVPDRLAGLVLVHTTPRNPFQTMAPVGLHRALVKPVFQPLLRFTRWVSPVVAVMNRLSHWNGTTHWNNELVLFGGAETREQLDRTARLATRMNPATHARFSLALTRYDGIDALSSITVPALVVAAERDPVTIPEASEMIADRIRGCDLWTLGGAKHMGFMEERKAFRDALQEFAKEIADEPRRRAGP